MGAIKKAVENISDGVDKIAKSVAQVAKCAVTLDMKGLAEATQSQLQGLQQIARGFQSLNPAAVAINTLTHGALEKLQKKMDEKTMEFTNRMVNGLFDSLDQVKQGAVKTAKSVVKGDLKGMAEGIKDVAKGAAGAAEYCTPSGIARKTAETALMMAVEEVGKQSHKLLGDSGVGGMFAYAITAGAEAGAASLESRRGGRTDRSHYTADRPFELKRVKSEAKEAARASAEEAAQSVINATVQQVMAELTTLLRLQTGQAMEMALAMMLVASQSSSEESYSQTEESQTQGRGRRAEAQERKRAGRADGAVGAGCAEGKGKTSDAGFKKDSADALGPVIQNATQQAIFAALEVMIEQLMKTLQMTSNSALGMLARGYLAHAQKRQMDHSQPEVVHSLELSQAMEALRSLMQKIETSVEKSASNAGNKFLSNLEALVEDIQKIATQLDRAPGQGVDLKDTEPSLTALLEAVNQALDSRATDCQSPISLECLIKGAVGDAIKGALKEIIETLAKTLGEASTQITIDPDSQAHLRKLMIAA